MEGLPFRLLLTLFLMAVVLVVGFLSLNVFMDFFGNKGLSDDINKMNDAMHTLQSTGDEGSFTKVHVSIPKDSFVSIENGSRELSYSLYGDNYTVNMSGEFLWDRHYDGGEYTFEIYYGSPGPSKNKSNSPYLIPFS